MKKRILFFFLVLTALFSTALLQPRSVLAANANTSVTPFPNPNYNVEKGTPSTSDAFSVAHVRNLNASGASQGTAARLEVVVQAKSFASATNVYAIVMRKSDYDTMMPNGPGARGINDTSYCTLSSDLGTTGTTYYGIGRGVTTANSTASVVLPVVIGSADNDKILGDGGNTSSIQRIFPKATVSGSNYLDEYTLIVFAFGYTGADNSTAYYIDNFYMDSEGYVYTPSYGVRYRDNNPPGTGSVANLPVNSAANTTATDRNTFIQRSAWNAETLGEGHPGDMTLSATIPTRTGYKFVGWTTEARTPLAEGEAVPTDANFYPAKGTFKEPAALNTIYDLYALWQVVPVKFSHTSTDTKKYTISQEGDAWILDWLNPLPQVGVSFSTGGIRYEQPGATGAEPNGSKTFNVAKYEDDKTTNETYGLTVGRLGATGDNSQWGIASAATGPTTHSNEKVVKFVITVTDPSNNTSDTITVRFGKIKKGAQPVPTLDDNTGLQSRITETESKDETGENVTGKDGQIYGFYSGGPTIETDTDKTGYLTVNTGSNGINGTYGTGTMTAYYLNLGMIYEYRPIKVGGTAVDYTDTELPNDGWREVPFPSGYYPGTNGAGTITALTPALEKNAKAVQHSNKISNRAAATLTAEANLSDSFKESGWPDSYGYIAFDETSKLPIVHGLAADDVYEVRFRANATYEVSDARTITIGGAVGGSGGDTVSGGLAVNLAGGTVLDGSKETYEQFVSDCHAMKPGESIAIPSFEPVRETYSFAGWTIGETDEAGNLITYRYSETDTPTITLGDNPMSLAAVWNSTTEGVIAVTAFDWDGVLLGSFIFRADNDPAVQEANAQEALKEFMGDAYVAPTEPDPEPTPEPPVEPTPDTQEALRQLNENIAMVAAEVAQGTTPYADDEGEGETPETPPENPETPAEDGTSVAAKLRSHAGYDFLAWVKNEDSIPTSYGQRVPSNTNTALTTLELTDTDKIDFSTLKNSTTVKAAYTTNDNIELGAGLGTNAARDARRYTTSIDSYGRFGTGNSFSIKIKVERGDVPRATNGALRVRMRIGTADIYSMYELSGADVEIVEVVPYASGTTAGVFTGASVVEWTIIDTYGLSNWVGSAARTTVTECQSTAAFTVQTLGRQSIVWNRGTYPFNGIISSINAALKEYHESGAALTVITSAVLRTVGINPYTDVANDLRTAIYNGWVAKGMPELDEIILNEIASTPPSP